MKLYAPKYYKVFKCIADRCEHSCCIGWEIDIDEKTLEKYKALRCGYGASVMSTVSTEDTPHFRLGNGDRCPHLDEKGLCKIILNLGEGYLCDICREHPRFYNFTNVAEVGIGISCPEATRLILSSSDYATVVELGEVNADPYVSEFDSLAERGTLYALLGDEKKSYPDRLKDIYRAYDLSVGTDGHWLKALDRLEYLDPHHKTMFMKYSSAHRADRAEKALERFLAYLIYRHTTEAIDEDDFRARLSFCLFCERLLSSLTVSEQADSLEKIAALASIVSEEIEYSEDNTYALMY